MPGLNKVRDADAANLQHDLDKLAEWESKWLMKFHPEKCNVLTISKSEVHLSTITHSMAISSNMIHQQNTWDVMSHFDSHSASLSRSC
jgi:hypothetical protein